MQMQRQFIYKMKTVKVENILYLSVDLFEYKDVRRTLILYSVIATVWKQHISD